MGPQPSSTGRAGLPRRGLLRAAAAVAGGLAAGPAAASPTVRRRGIPLGYDNSAGGAMQWTARQLVDHAVELGCDSVFITDFAPFAGRDDDAALGELRRSAADRGVAIALGSWSICPTSKSFKPDWGTAEEHLARGIRMARALGSPAFRVIVGSHDDRLTPGGIAARITDTVAVLRAVKPRALDAGVKVAVENHAGDMQSRELLRLVQEAGPEFVGVNFDSGNACWTLEDPLAALDRLAPFVVTTSLRDTMLWETPEGVTAQWTALGEGCTDLPAFFDLFEKRCPGVTVHVETISGFAKPFACWSREFWRAYPEARAEDFAGFLALAKRGRPLAPFRPPEGAARAEAERRYQLGELERSIRHARDVLGLGVRT
jgi:sugar phosphate isomerase/epimerase